MPEASLTAEQRQRYARHLALAEIGPAGQRRLLRSSVLIVGVGALGSPVALYLAAAGVGAIGLADHDHVRLSNLQRQVIHSMAGLNRSKVDGAARTVSALNPDVKVDAVEATVDEHNAMELLQRYDVIVDGTDTFRARYLLSDAAYLLRKPLVHGSIFRIEGQVTVFVPGRGCYRCLYPEPPPAGAIEAPPRSVHDQAGGDVHVFAGDARALLACQEDTCGGHLFGQGGAFECGRITELAHRLRLGDAA